MTALQQWKQKYEELKEFIKANPEIHIDENEVSIPESLRKEFYEKFDNVRDAVVAPFFTSLPMDVNTLSRNYVRSEKEFLEISGLERIDLPVDLSSFLQNPKECLERGIFHRLFELAQGKMTEEDFEQMAGTDLSATAWNLFRLGYESWAVLSLLYLLEPDELLGVGLDEDLVPFTFELKEIAFGRQYHDPAKRLPEFILHSKKLGRYVAVKIPVVKEVDFYYMPIEVPDKMFRDRTGDTSRTLGTRMMFLSVIDDLEKIPIFVDMYTRKINSPDLTVEFMMEQDISDSDEVAQVMNRVELMKPLRGCSIIIMGPEAKININMPEGVKTFIVGIETSKLQPVIDILA